MTRYWHDGICEGCRKETRITANDVCRECLAEAISENSENGIETGDYE